MFDMLFDIDTALQKAKQEHSLGKTIGIALIASVLIGIASGLLVSQFPSRVSAMATSLSALTTLGTGFLAVVVFILVFLLILLMGLVTELVANALGGKGTYFSGLTAVSYSSFVSAIGCFLGALLNFVPVIGLVIGVVVALIFFPLSMAVLYRSIKELFETDMITAFITVACVTTGFLAAIYFTTFMAMGLAMRQLETQLSAVQKLF
ncbi:MAG: YIP1 family protein [Candidatus Diapherotrites archaeon]|nr:YIP1 family protein [Candidatus Diapherotrites archaeon]